MIAASLHYFRRRPDEFPAALAALRRLGADAVESPVPWSVHDDHGRLDFARDAAHLVAFLEQAARVGLGVHLRLGPLVGADLTHLGLPPSVAGDTALAARHADGTPQVVPLPPRWLLAPSYAARAFRERCADWIAAAAAAVRPFAGPDGPLRSVLLGDCWPFAGRNPSACPDHHPDACAAWEETRASAAPEAAERLYAAFAADPLEVAPARPLAGIGRARFAERTYVAFLHGLAVAAAVLGDAVPLATTLPPAGLFAPVGAGLLGGAFDRVGLDAWGRRARPAPLARDVRLLAGTVRRPFASFVPVGTPPWLPQLDAADQLHTLRTCLAAGVDGIVLSMGVGRDRWCGGLLDETLREQDGTHVVRRLLHGLGRASWLRGRRRARAALLVPRDYVRGAQAAVAALVGAPAPGLAAAWDLPPPAALDPADRTPAGGAWWAWLEAAERALQELGVPYDLVDDEGPVAVAAPLLLAPTLEDCPRATVERVRAQLARGAAALCGPARPLRDLETGAALPGGLPEPDAAPAADRIARALGAAHRPPPVAGLERAVLVDDAGAPVGLVLLNRSASDVPLGVALEGLDAADGVTPPAAGRDSAIPAWSDLDEPGGAPAAGRVAPGEVRLLVPGARRREAP